MLAIISKIKDKIKNLKSLRFQSLFIMFLIGLIPILIFMLVITNSYRQKAISQRVSELQARGAVLSNLILSSGFLTNDVTNEVESEMTQISDIYGGRIMILNSGLTVMRDTYGLEEGKVMIAPEVIQCLKNTETRIVNQTESNIEIIIPLLSSSKKSVTGVIVMDFSSQNLVYMLDEIMTIPHKMLVLLIIVIMLSAIFYSREVVAPLKRVNVAIDHITDGYLDEQVELTGVTEIEDISESLNQMTAMLHNLEDTRQEFVSNVSHELKTPITSIKVLAESLTMQEDAPVELYREFMEDINEELERLTKIINDLLSLVRMDKNASAMNVEEVNVNEFLESILKRLRPIADQRNIELIYESLRPVNAQIDTVKMSMAFTNLIENAIKYNFDDGWVRVSLNADHKFFYLKVSDSGVGIPEELQDHIFERFYRVDKARSRETGGNGLGLAITRNAILLHRGSIKVHSVEKQGTTFNIRIPLTYLE